MKSSPQVLLLHSAGTGAAMWHAQLAAWSPRLHAIAVNLPGHGARAEEPFTLSEAVKTVTDILAGMDRPVVLIGASLGGYVAALATAAHPAPIGGLIISGVLPAVNGGLALRCRAIATIDIAGASLLRLRPSALRHIALKGLAREVGPDIAHEIAASGLRPTARAECLRSLAGLDLRPALSCYRGPLLIINGENDKPAIRHQDELAALVPGAQIQTIENAGHMPSLDAPDRFNSAVHDFVGGRS